MKLHPQCFAIAIALLLPTLGCQQSQRSSSAAAKRAESSLGLRGSTVKLVKEVDYTNAPMYSLLVFGPDAERQHWLVVDGGSLYIDRNSNGDITDPEDRILIDQKATDALHVRGNEFSRWDIFKINELEGFNFELRVWIENPNFEPGPDESDYIREWRNKKRANGWVNSSLMRITSESRFVQTPVILCPATPNAQITHVDGPLVFNLKRGDRQCLERDKENQFDINIGTQGKPTLNHTEPVFSNLSTDALPSTLSPVAVFEFPSKNSDSEIIELSVNLDQRC